MLTSFEDWQAERGVWPRVFRDEAFYAGWRAYEKHVKDRVEGNLQELERFAPYDGRWTHLEGEPNCPCDGCQWEG